MSRIFEALKKAGEAKMEQDIKIENSMDFVPPNIPADGNGSSPEWHLGGQRRPIEATLGLPANNHGGKSWRERMEEIFFGWDLRRYQSYPIPVLEKDSVAAEQYKILREQVKRLRYETGARFLSVTSPVKQDGKTTVAVNLAVAMALEYEEEVLLIDGDLRSPQVHRYFGLEVGPGLADYLSSNNSDNRSFTLKDTFLPGLKILPAGYRTDLSAELLAKVRMHELMEEIRSRWPNFQIIVDTPPILSTPDPMILSRDVDGIIMVIRARKTPRDYLLKSLQSLGSSKVLGIVFNDADLGMGSKYYYYYSAERDH